MEQVNLIRIVREFPQWCYLQVKTIIQCHEDHVL